MVSVERFGSGVARWTPCVGNAVGSVVGSTVGSLVGSTVGSIVGSVVGTVINRCVCRSLRNAQVMVMWREVIRNAVQRAHGTPTEMRARDRIL